MNPGFFAHLRETGRLTVAAAAETVLPPVVLALAALALAASFPGSPAVEGLALPTWLAGGLAVATAAYGAFAALFRLVEEMEAKGILQEALAAPLGGGALALAWLLPAAGAGFAGGFLVLALGGRIAGFPLEPATLGPLAFTAAFFAGLALPAWLFLPRSWAPAFRLYVLPLLVLAGALAPASAWAPAARALILLDPAYQGAVSLRGFLLPSPPGIHPLWFTGILLALSAGFWSFSIDICRRGLGLRTR